MSRGAPCPVTLGPNAHWGRCLGANSPPNVTCTVPRTGKGGGFHILSHILWIFSHIFPSVLLPNDSEPNGDKSTDTVLLFLRAVRSYLAKKDIALRRGTCIISLTPLQVPNPSRPPTLHIPLLCPHREPPQVPPLPPPHQPSPTTRRWPSGKMPLCNARVHQCAAEHLTLCRFRRRLV